MTRPAKPADLRTEGRHVTLLIDSGSVLPVTVCGLCSALVDIGNDGELRHALFHDATNTITALWTTP